MPWSGGVSSILLFCPWAPEAARPRGSCCSPKPEAGAGLAHTIGVIVARAWALCWEKQEGWEEQEGWAGLTARLAPQHLHLRAGADRAAASVGAACVRSLISLLDVADSQASILGQVDVVAIPPHGNSVPVVKNKIFHYCHPWVLKELPVLFGK